MNASTITVVSITWNSRVELQQTRCSVEGQSYEHVHHLIIDGASTDGTSEMLASWPVDDRVRWISEPDDGIYDAMNKAISHIDTDYLMFLHAGDSFVDSGSLSRAMRAIAEAPTPPDLAIGWSRLHVGGNELPFVVGGVTPNALTSAHESTIFSLDFHRNERYVTDYTLAADYHFFRELHRRDDLSVLRLDFTVSNFAFGGRSNDPNYDGVRFLERVRINADFGDGPSAITYAKVSARMLIRRAVYRMAGPERAATFFLRVACRRGNSGARSLPLGQVQLG